MARLGAIFCQLAAAAHSKWSWRLQAVKISGQAGVLQAAMIVPSAAVKGLASVCVSPPPLVGEGGLVDASGAQ